MRKRVAHHREDAEWDIVVPAGAKHRPECGKGRCIMKKKDFRRGISVLLAAVMLLGTISVEGLADHAEEQDATWEDTGLLVNGDFEDGDNGWTVSGGNAGCKVENNTYATNIPPTITIFMQKRIPSSYCSRSYRTLLPAHIR